MNSLKLTIVCAAVPHHILPCPRSMLSILITTLLNETQFLPSLSYCFIFACYSLFLYLLFYLSLNILLSVTTSYSLLTSSHSLIHYHLFTFYHSLIYYLFFSLSNLLPPTFQIVGVKSLRLTLTSNSLEQNFFTSSSSSSSTGTDGVSNSH